MRLIDRLTDKQIHEIAEMIDAANDICYLNSDTGEYILIPNRYLAKYYFWKKNIIFAAKIL